MPKPSVSQKVANNTQHENHMSTASDCRPWTPHRQPELEPHLCRTPRFENCCTKSRVALLAGLKNSHPHRMGGCPQGQGLCEGSHPLGWSETEIKPLKRNTAHHLTFFHQTSVDCVFRGKPAGTKLTKTLLALRSSKSSGGYRKETQQGDP